MRLLSELVLQILCGIFFLFQIKDSRVFDYADCFKISPVVLDLCMSWYDKHKHCICQEEKARMGQPYHRQPGML